MERLGCPLVLLVLFFGLVQFALGYQGIEYELGTGWAIIAVAAALIFKFTLPITIGTYFGVVHVHGGPWWAGLLVAAPGLLVAVPFMATTVLAFILDSGKKVWASTGEQPQDITPLRPSVTHATQNTTASTSAYTPSQTDTTSQSAPYRPTDTSPSVIHVTPTPKPATNTPTASAPTPSTAAFTPNHTDPYQQAGEEILKGNLDPAIWARSLVEGAGNDGAVKAAYVKLRVAQLNAAIEAEVERVRAEVATRAEAARAKAEEEILLQYGISRTGDQFVRNDNGVMRKYYNLEVAVAAERTIQAEAAAEAEKRRVMTERARAEAAESKRRAEAEAARVKAVEEMRREKAEAAQVKAAQEKRRADIEAMHAKVKAAGEKAKAGAEQAKADEEHMRVAAVRAKIDEEHRRVAAVRAKIDEEHRRAKEKEKNRDPLITAYAQQHGLTYEDAVFFLPFGIGKFGSKFVVNNHSFDKLEDAIHHVRKAGLLGSEATTAQVAREKFKEEKGRAEAVAAREKAERENREVATIIAARAKAATVAAQVKVDEENRRTESKTSLEAPILTTSDYAALMRVGYEEAEKMQPWRIYRLGNQYAISYNGIDYTYDKLEDAISRAKRLEGGDADV